MDLPDLDPGDEIVIIEPAHENYIPSAIFCGAKAVSVPLDEPGYRLRWAARPELGLGAMHGNKD